MPDRTVPRLLAGAPWRDHHRAPRPADAPRWFEPIHVREPGRVRQALAAQVEAGADIVMAPAWLTHRRALMEIGESRRAVEWTAAAVRVAREAVEEGLPRRTAARSDALVVVAGPLPDLDARPETGSGRLAERGAAADRDRDAQAGILAETGVDLILVEAHSTAEGGSRSIAAAAATGLEAWATIRSSAGDLDTWREAFEMAGASTILLEVPALTAEGLTGDGVDALVERSTRLEDRLFGVQLEQGQPELGIERIRQWLERGASVLGVAEGATPGALRPLREAIEAEAEARRAVREASEAPWRAWVAGGGERAPSGSALWLVDDAHAVSARMHQSPAMPDGFAWTLAAASELSRLPASGYRFIVAAADVDMRGLVQLLDEGGIAVARLATDELPRLDGAQIIDVRRDGAVMMITLRRVR